MFIETTWRDLRRRFGDVWRISRRQIRRFFSSPELAFEYWRYLLKIRRRDWIGIKQSLDRGSQLALASRDFRFVAELGHAALRLGELPRGMTLLEAARQHSAEPKQNAWRGEDISDATLLIELMENEKQAVALGAAFVGYIRTAAMRARKTVVVAESRMVPLFRRSLPDVVVLPFGSNLSEFVENRVVTAAPMDLAVNLGCDENAISRFYSPVVADESQSKALRASYLCGRSIPLIGISWWSSHVGKDLPPVPQWARLVHTLPAQFVSLQYSQSKTDINLIRGSDPGKLIDDPAVDQMKNMDLFASQIAALDLTITISNSGAHLAGATGQRTILLRDDLFRRDWPYLSRKVAWYPNMLVVGKDGRDWNEVFEEVISVAQKMAVF